MEVVTFDFARLHQVDSVTIGRGTLVTIAVVILLFKSLLFS